MIAEQGGRRLGAFGWLALAVCLCGFARGTEPSVQPTDTSARVVAEDRAGRDDLPEGLYAKIATPRGLIVAELFPKKAPLAVMNFVGLAEGVFPVKQTKPFFDGLTFHRVVPGFVVQGGDPAGRGDGGPGYSFPDEFIPGLGHDAAGVLSMANNGPDTNGSQFFFTLVPVRRLDYLHTVFGRVVRGLEVLPAIQRGDTMTVKIRRVGAEAGAYRADPNVFFELSRETAFKAYLAERDLSQTYFDDRDRLLPQDPPRAKAFNQKLGAFARVTGRKIFVQLLAKMPSPPEGKRLGDYTRQLAGSIGAAKDGVLVVYVAEKDEWKLWIGDNLLPVLMGRSGKVEEFMRYGALHEKKEALLAAAKRRLSAPGDPAEPTAQRLKLACDDVLEALISALEPTSVEMSSPTTPVNSASLANRPIE